MWRTYFQEPTRTDLSPGSEPTRVLAQAVIGAEEQSELSGSILMPRNYPELSSYLLTTPHVTKALITSVDNYTTLRSSFLPSSPNPCLIETDWMIKLWIFLYKDLQLSKELRGIPAQGGMYSTDFYIKRAPYFRKSALHMELCSAWRQISL